VHAQQAHLAELGPEVVRQRALFVPLGDVRRQLGVGEGSDGVADVALVLVEQPVDSEEVMGVGHVRQPTTTGCPSTGSWECLGSGGG
jgi:hypothetical protein